MSCPKKAVGVILKSVVKVTGYGLLDFIVDGKAGLFLFENLTPHKSVASRRR